MQHIFTYGKQKNIEIRTGQTVKKQILGFAICVIEPSVNCSFCFILLLPCLFFFIKAAVVINSTA